MVIPLENLLLLYLRPDLDSELQDTRAGIPPEKRVYTADSILKVTE